MEKTFEEAVKELEEIINSLENGTETLEESMKIFEDGMKLVEYCNGKLECAEKKIVELTQKGEDIIEENLEV